MAALAYSFLCAASLCEKAVLDLCPYKRDQHRTDSFKNISFENKKHKIFPKDSANNTSPESNSNTKETAVRLKGTEMLSEVFFLNAMACLFCFPYFSLSAVPRVAPEAC